MSDKRQIVLHDGALHNAGDYWACQQPERPHDEQTAYDHNCHWCMVKMRLAVADGHGADEIEATETDTFPCGEMVSLSQILESVDA